MWQLEMVRGLDGGVGVPKEVVKGAVHMGFSLEIVASETEQMS